MEINEYAKQLGKRGGDKTKKKHGKDYYREIGKKGGIAKAAKKANV